MADDREQRLDRVFAEYRDACPDVEPAANFMPRMWERIESRRNPLFTWVLMSRRALVGALALCVVLGFALGTAFSSSQFYQTTYVEALDSSAVPEDLAAMHPVSFESGPER